MSAGDYRCVVFWSGGPGQGFAYNVIHLQGDVGLADQDSADAIAGALGSAFASPGWADAISDRVTLKHVTLQELTDPPSAEFIGAIDIDGEAPGNHLPPEVSLVTSLHSVHPGKRGRGRIYNWGFTEACNDDAGQCDVSCQSIVNQGWADFYDNIIGLDPQFSLAVYSRLDDQTYNVASVTTNREWDEQRRRRH